MSKCACAKCDITFTSLTAFDQHLGKLTKEAGYEHRKPEEAGLVVREDGTVSLPPEPGRERFWEKHVHQWYRLPVVQFTLDYYCKCGTMDSLDWTSHPEQNISFFDEMIGQTGTFMGEFSGP